MQLNDSLCFYCMQKLKSHGKHCTCCGHDNSIRRNELGFLAETLLEGRYQTGALIHKNPFCNTYSGYDHQLHRRVFIKNWCLHNSQLPSFDTQRKAILYFRSVSQAPSVEGIQQIYDAFAYDDNVFVVAEYIEGILLSDYIRLKKYPLDITRAVKILTPVVDALSRLHSTGRIHYDVCPDNIMICTDTEKTTLLDFCLCQCARFLPVSINPYVSLHYHAPEEYSLFRDDQRMDVYSLGATLCFLFTKLHPPESIYRIDHQQILHFHKDTVSAGLEMIINKAMDINPEERYSSVSIFWDAVLDEINILSSPETKSPKHSKKRKKFLFF